VPSSVKKRFSHLGRCEDETQDDGTRSTFR
jgi:hypothetical protein